MTPSKKIAIIRALVHEAAMQAAKAELAKRDIRHTLTFKKGEKKHV